MNEQTATEHVHRLHNLRNVDDVERGAELSGKRLDEASLGEEASARIC